MGKFWALLFLVGAFFLGFWVEKSPEPKKRKKEQSVHPEREYPLICEKTFVFVVYAKNDAAWCERTLRSIFEQNYESYRVILIDDGSNDQTWERVHQYVIANNQDHRVILIQNEEALGKGACFYRAMHQLLDTEIAILLDAKDWLVQENVLNRLNACYQNPDVWITLSPGLSYPDYELQPPVISSFYAAFFKKIRLSDLYREKEFVQDPLCWTQPITELAGRRQRVLSEPQFFINKAYPTLQKKEENRGSYEPLAFFPNSYQRESGAIDLIVFSYDRPLQLYACLESIQRYFSGSFQIQVLYRCSDERYGAGYKELSQAFPHVIFIQQPMNKPKRHFKEYVVKMLNSSSPYVLFAVDDIIVKDRVDLNECVQFLETTGGYGFFLRLGKHTDYCYVFAQDQPIPPSISVGSHVYAWDFALGAFDWGFAHNLDMTLYRKSDVIESLQKGKYETPNSMEQEFAKRAPKKGALGLYFEQSKIVNLPLNVTSKSSAAHMDFMTTEELLAVFNQGLKIDIAPFYQIENRSPHFEKIPEFKRRNMQRP